jgi:hypothetical protein
MTVRAQFAAARIRSFAEAAEAYVLRVQDDGRPGSDRRAVRANTLRRSVMLQLSTDSRRLLIYRFANFFSLAQAAGVEPLELCFDPPVFPTDARRAFATAAPDWISEDALRDPRGQGGHQVFVGSIPELCCFGFIATELFVPVMLRWIEAPVSGDTPSVAQALTADLTRAVSELAADTAMSDHDSRTLFQIVETLEQVAGADFSLSQLTDSHVLEAWQCSAEATGITRFAEFLRQISALSVEVQASEAASAATQADELDGLGVNERNALAVVPDWVAHALSEPLLVELLSRDQSKIARQQLDTLAALSGLYLSRARAMTFGPVENRIIQAKRLKRDASDVAAAGRQEVSHGRTLTMLQDLVDKVDAFLRASVHLLWTNNRRADAVHLATLAGYVSGMNSSVVGREPEGAWRDTLESGATAWHDLRRRVAFARCDADAEAVDELEDAAVQAARLLHAVGRLRGRIDLAVGERREGQPFMEEYDMFCAALGQVHRFGFPGASQ